MNELVLDNIPEEEREIRRAENALRWRKTSEEVGRLPTELERAIHDLRSEK